MKRTFGTRAHALTFAAAILPILAVAFLASCSNPSSSPATGPNTANYSASAFFNTEPLGDTTKPPFPYCFPVEYLQQKLGLTDTQVVQIQAVQDSLCAALKARLDAMKAAGTLNCNSVHAIRFEFQTQLYVAISSILTADQLAILQTLQPPQEPRDHFRRGGRGEGRDDHRGGDRRGPNGGPKGDPVVNDSLMLVHMQADLTNAGFALTADQIAAIQTLQAAVRADTTLTPDARRAKMEAGLQTILNADQLAALKKLGQPGEHRRHR